MSEKSLWQWLTKKMGDKWDGHRIENCSSKGIPDAVVSFNKNGKTTTFVELKDWSEKSKHPLSVDQLNFLATFGGVVLVKVSKEEIRVHCGDVIPLLSCDLTWAKENGVGINMRNFDPDTLITTIDVYLSKWAGG